MSLTKIVNGNHVPCGPAEDAQIRTEWTANANNPPPLYYRQEALAQLRQAIDSNDQEAVNELVFRLLERGY